MTDHIDDIERDSAWAVGRIRGWVAYRRDIIAHWEPQPAPPVLRPIVLRPKRWS